MKKILKGMAVLFFSIMMFNVSLNIVNAVSVKSDFILIAKHVEGISIDDKGTDNKNSGEVSTSCNAILGDVNDSTSVAHLLQEIFKVMKFAAPIMVLAFSIIDFIKAVSSQDKDQLQKAIKKTIIRIIIGLIVFVIPSLCNFIFEIVGWYGTCGIK